MENKIYEYSLLTCKKLLIALPQNLCSEKQTLDEIPKIKSNEDSRRMVKLLDFRPLKWSIATKLSITLLEAVIFQLVEYKQSVSRDSTIVW